MNRFHLLRISSVLFALTACHYSLQAATLSVSATPISLTCTQGQPCSSSGTSNLSISSGTGYYTVTPPSRDVHAVFPPGGTLVPKTRAFVDLLDAFFRRQRTA